MNPPSWNPWPPSQERIDRIIARAVPAIIADATARFGAGVEYEVAVATPGDLSGWFPDGTNSGPPAEYATAGWVYVHGHNKRYCIRWDPADDTGYGELMSDYQWRPGKR